MLLKAYVGDSSGKAKRVKKIYEGNSSNKAKLVYNKNNETSELMHYELNGTNKNINKAYIGDQDGKAQLIYNPTVISKTLNAERLSVQVSNTSRPILALNSNYVVCCGTGSNYNGTQAISKNYILTSASSLSDLRQGSSGATVGDYAFFAGGSDASSGSGQYKYSTRTDGYNSNLVRTSGGTLSQARTFEGIDSTSDYVICAGGFYNAGNNGSWGACNNVDAFNTNLTKTSMSNLSYKTEDYAIGHVNNSVILGGGLQRPSNWTNISTVYKWSNSLSMTTLTSLPNPGTNCTSCSIDNYCLFANIYAQYPYPNYNNNTLYRFCVAYNNNFTRITCTNPTYDGTLGRGFSCDRKALFMIDGYTYGNDSTNTPNNVYIESYDENLVKSIINLYVESNLSYAYGVNLESNKLLRVGSYTDLYSFKDNYA